MDRWNEDHTEVVETAEERQVAYYAGDKSAQDDLAIEVAKAVVDRTETTAPALPKPRTAMKRNFKFTWFNWAYPPEMFQTNLRYPHPDTRPFEANVRTPTWEYIDRGDTANVIRAKYQTWLDARGKAMPKKPKDCSYLGVHDICPLVEELDSFDFTNFCYDLMHYLSNISLYLMKLYKGVKPH